MEFPILAGTIAAIIHVMAGPDHLAAVMPIVVETKKKHWTIGLMWGIGHVVGMLLISALFYLFKDLISPDLISKHSEQLVGLMLILIGVWGFYRLQSDRSKHKHPHVHIDNNKKPYIHTHEHEHIVDNHGHKTEAAERRNKLTAATIGLIHGFAGVSHFLLMLPVLGFESKAGSVFYILGFVAGTPVAMILFALVVGKLKIIQKLKGNKYLFFNIRFISALAAVFVGVFWLARNIFITS